MSRLDSTPDAKADPPSHAAPDGAADGPANADHNAARIDANRLDRDCVGTATDKWGIADGLSK